LEVKIMANNSVFIIDSDATLNGLHDELDNRLAHIQAVASNGEFDAEESWEADY
jgi:hypothetical protein